MLASVIWHEKCMCCITLLSAACWAVTYFTTLSQTAQFSEKIY